LNYYVTDAIQCAAVREAYGTIRNFQAMNAFVFPFKRGNSFFRRAVACSASNDLPARLLLSFVCQQIAFGQSDDFNDGNDNGWVRLRPVWHRHVFLSQL